MKKTISILLCAVMLLMSTACGNKVNTTATSYDELLVKLGQTVHSLFAKDYEDDVKAGKLPSPTGELEDKWMTLLLDAKSDFHNIDENSFGYRIIDLNSDSSPELLLERSDDRILAIYTMHEGKPMLVDCFNRSYRCVVMETGELYTMTIRDDGGYDYRIHTLNPSTGTFVTTVSFGIESGICYESIEGSIYTTSTERIDEFLQKYPFELSEAYKTVGFNLF